MKLKSNVTVLSNIFVIKNKNSPIKNDKEFVCEVRGRDALKKISSKLGSLNYLSSVQKEELAYGLTCTFAKDTGEMTHGVIIEGGEHKWVCKCENTECKLYDNCSNDKDFRLVNRERYGSKVPNEDSNIAIDVKYLSDEDEKIIFNLNGKQNALNQVVEEVISVSLIDSSDGKFESDDSDNYPEHEQPTVTEIHNEPVDTQHHVLSTEYTILTEPSEIVMADINSRITVNAGPGTGKTYTVIKRLEHIIKNNMADPHKVLVLCYSRSAVHEIKNRMKIAIDNNELRDEAQFLQVRTFDSFATWMFEKEEVMGLSYDQRIEKFNRELVKNPENLDGLEYLIVDEMQDLVNVRAIMVKNILQSIDCGFLLLGDKCQAIYDWDCEYENSCDSTQFYQWLENWLGNDVLWYELSYNHRQTPALSKFTGSIRQKLLQEEGVLQWEYIKESYKTLDRAKPIGQITDQDLNLPGNTAFLCRNNGQAAKISDYFYYKCIDHSLMKKAAQHHSINSWVAQLFWDYVDTKINHNTFLILALRRLLIDVETIETYWNALHSLVGSDPTGTLDVHGSRGFIGWLAKGADLPKKLAVLLSSKIIVSTIHRAKGREYENVFLLDNLYCQKGKEAEEARVRYVAFTRPRKSLFTSNITLFYKQLDSGRCIEISKSRDKNTYCKSIVIGLEHDIAPSSFVDINIFSSEESVIDNQKYINECVNVGDELEVHRLNDEYLIFHQGKEIGALSSVVKHDLRDAMNKTNHSRNLPTKLSSVYVENIVTIVNTEYNESIPLSFRESGVWLGIEITGFAKTEWQF